MAELVNKINGPWFSKFDEDLATAFSIYCGISIAHVSSSWAGPVHLCAPLHTGSPCPIQTGPCPAWDSGPCCRVAEQPSVPLASIHHQKAGDTLSCPVQLACQDMGDPFCFPHLQKQPQSKPPGQLLFGTCWVSLSRAGSSSLGIQNLGP